jgi:ATP-dependent helicase/nuclease subunit A
VTPRDDATLAQIAAADPGRSTWLSANAGSGKTRVLTDRVSRLLLAGVNPQRILCLTYTKAAAGEMQNRLFARLGAWSMLDDEALDKALRDLGVEESVSLATARTLFAAAIETPGGLKIQTIHSFCAALLRHYPLEAGVSPRFAEMDEVSDRQLMAEVAEALADGPEVHLVDEVARHYSGTEFDRLTAEIVRCSEAFAGEVDTDRIFRDCGIAPGLTEVQIAAEVFSGTERAIMDALLPTLAVGSANDVKAAEALAGMAGRPLGFEDLPDLECFLLYGKDAKAGAFASKAGKFPTSPTRKALGDAVCADLDALMDRVAAARRNRVSLAAARKTVALRRFAAAFLPAYESRKQAQGWLSFDDLIRRARDLLRDRAVADWVLYRLDGGIDHILVDEAQDTSPAQWEVIEHLACEFTSGEGARSNRVRTLFVVGDKKQSIYSFQGADAEGFDRMRDHFEAQLGAHSPLARRALLYSFRSSTAVLHAVDRTFATEVAGGVSTELRHHAHHGDLPGRVDIWPLIEPAPKDDPGDWEKPVDSVAPNHHVVDLANGIAAEIEAMLARGETIPDKDGRFRTLAPGDFLILVQRRAGKPSLFHEIIAALKARRLPVAGADRLRLRDSLAVRDLLALLAFLALPEDDLSLAAALRSPLFGWSEGQLYALAAGRGRSYLWATLRERKAEYPDLVCTLDDLRTASDFLRPYDLLERILVRHGGRERLLARLGVEAEDGIDELLNLALAYERADVPSLTGFLSWLEAEDTEIKRQSDGAGHRIRVMTVHGAKGLEAPVVILPDTVRRKQGLRGEVVVADDGTGWWVTPQDTSPEVIDRAREAALAAEERERERLLYVAMTRAQTWLIICGAGKPADAIWHRRIQDGLDGLDLRAIETPFGDGRRFQHGDWQEADAVPSPPRLREIALPEWLTSRAAAPAERAPLLRPSDLGGAKALPGEGADFDEDMALRRGRQIHRLLEHLPAHAETDWPSIAPALLSHGEDAATGEEATGLLAEVTGILTASDLAPLFAKDTLAEVAVTCCLPMFPDRPLDGVIDRLVVTPDRVLVVDFKTNAVVPASPGEVPEGLLRQMGAYAAAMAEIYPGRRVDAAILWTRTATLMNLPHDMVMAALARTPTS